MFDNGIMFQFKTVCPWPRGSSRKSDEGLNLGLGLGTSGLGFGLERQVLALPRPKPRLFPQDPGQVVRVCSAHTHGVTKQSTISCSGMFHRLACKSDVGCKIIRIYEVWAV